MTQSHKVPPAIRMELVDGSNTWITHMPIRSANQNELLAVIGEVCAWFTRGIVQDQDAVERHLREALGEREAVRS